MKAELKDPSFKPFTVELSVESREELAALWLYLTADSDKVVESNQRCLQDSEAKLKVTDEDTICDLTYPLWKILDSQWNKLEEQ
jgi:hypothetical protein